MAKVKVRSPKSRTNSLRRFHVEVNVERSAASSTSGAYFACVHAQKSGRRRDRGRQWEQRSACAYAPAPRRAIAAAMRKFAATIEGRSSSFSGR